MIGYGIMRGVTMGVVFLVVPERMGGSNFFSQCYNGEKKKKKKFIYKGH